MLLGNGGVTTTPVGGLAFTVSSEEVITLQDLLLPLFVTIVVRIQTKGPQNEFFSVKLCIYDIASPHTWGNSCLNSCVCVKKSTIATTRSKEKVEIMKSNLDFHKSFILNNLLFLINRTSTFFFYIRVSLKLCPL